MEDVLIRIIQLVILCIPLITLPLILKSSNKILGQISNGAQKFQNASGMTQAGNKMQGGARGFARNKALNMEAKMAKSENGALSRVGGYRNRKKKRAEDRDGIRSQMHEEAYYEGMAGSDIRALKRRKRAMGIGGAAAEAQAERLGRQSGGYAEAKERERVSEEMKHLDGLLSTSRSAAEAVVSGKRSDIDSLSGSDRKAYDQFQAAGGASTLAGAKVAASVLGKTGGLNAEAIQSLSASGVVGIEQGIDFADHANSVAREAGMDYLAESTTDQAGQLVLGGQRGSSPTASLETEINGKGYGSMARQSFEDGTEFVDSKTGVKTSAKEIIGKRLVSDLIDPNKSASTRRQLAKMDDRKIASAAKAAHSANPTMFTNEAQAIDQFNQFREQGRRENPGVS